MKQKFVTVITASVVVFFMQCYKFDEIVQIPSQPKKLVLFSEMFAGEDGFQYAIISRTRDLNQKIVWDFKQNDIIFKNKDTVVRNNVDFLEFDTVRGAKVVFQKNGEQERVFNQEDPFLKVFYTDYNLKLKGGDVCTLKVSAPGYETISAVQKVPNTVKLLSAKFVRNGYTSQNTGTLSVIELTFQDPPGEENFYYFDTAELIKKDNLNQGTRFRGELFVKIDPNATTRRFINDRLFDGKLYKWRIGVSFQTANQELPDEYEGYIIRFRSTVRDYEKYNQIIEARAASADNPFSEPITPFSNVSNGLGLFVVSGQADTVSVKFK